MLAICFSGMHCPVLLVLQVSRAHETPSHAWPDTVGVVVGDLAPDGNSLLYVVLCACVVSCVCVRVRVRVCVCVVCVACWKKRKAVSLRTKTS
jgi:hypothetical protein